MVIQTQELCAELQTQKLCVVLQTQELCLVIQTVRSFRLKNSVWSFRLRKICPPYLGQSVYIRFEYNHAHIKSSDAFTVSFFSAQIYYCNNDTKFSS
jgi:hypothetical protein